MHSATDHGFEMPVPCSTCQSYESPCKCDVEAERQAAFDLPLPEGWTWERVATERAMWDIADNMIPVALGPGCVAWGTINSVRKRQAGL